MTQCPIFGVDKRCRKAPERAKWLQDIFECAGAHISEDKKVRDELWNWTEAIERIDYAPGIVTVYWSDSIAISCSESSFAALWNRLGDGTPLEHIAMDEIYDGDRTLREMYDLP